MRNIVVLVVLGLAACSGTASSPTPTVLNGTWRIVSVQPELLPLQPAPPGALYEVTFDGSRISARLDCNTCSGTAMLSGSAVVIGPGLACTRAACATASFESVVVGILSGAHDIVATSNTLVLHSIRGSITLVRR